MTTVLSSLPNFARRFSNHTLSVQDLPFFFLILLYLTHIYKMWETVLCYKPEGLWKQPSLVWIMFRKGVTPVSIRNLSGKQPNTNLNERTKFSYVSFHLFFLINFKSDKKSEPGQTPCLKPILFSPSKPKSKISHSKSFSFFITRKYFLCI
jgi:hypothetical protein